MHLFHLKYVDWLDSQLIYHALPRAGVEGILILAPSSPYICIGYHQNLEQEVDLEYCKVKKIPIFRREVGGGAVFLDGDQIFYQIVLHKDNPLAQGEISEFYRRLLEPVTQTYDNLGIPTKFRPVNDVITLEGRKISGTGAADIGEYRILVGNLIADFDYKTMTEVLRVPDEKFRDKVFKSMTENLTTIKREIGRLPSWEEMTQPLIHNYEKVLGKLEVRDVPEKVQKQIDIIKPEFLDDNWLFMKRRHKIGAATKIATDVNIIQKLHKAPGGLLKSVFELKGDIISNLSLTGDFFCYPNEVINDLETFLEGSKISSISRKVEAFYDRSLIETPGVTPQDWLKVLN